MPAVNPNAFNTALAGVEQITHDHVGTILQAFVDELKLQEKNPSAEDISTYLALRAEDIRGRAPKDAAMQSAADLIETAATDLKLDASFFERFLGLAYIGHTVMNDEKAHTLVRLFDWLEPQIPASKKRAFLSGVADTLNVKNQPSALVELRERIVEERSQLGEFRKDQVLPQDTLERIPVYELRVAETELVRIAPVGRRGQLDADKVAWYRHQRLNKRPAVMKANYKLIDQHIDQLAAKAEFMNTAPKLRFDTLSPGSIPDPEIRAAAMAVALTVNDKSSAADGKELNFVELEIAMRALRGERDPDIRARLLKTYNEVANVRVDSTHSVEAVKALLSHLEVVRSFMYKQDNGLLTAGYAQLELGIWKGPIRRVEPRVVPYFLLPDKNGEFDYSVDRSEAAGIHEFHKAHLERTNMNVVSFHFNNRVWAAVSGHGDLESIGTGLTKLTLFDAFKMRGEDAVENEPLHRMTEPGTVVGVVDPLVSSGGEAIWRTNSRLVSSVTGAVQALVNNESFGKNALENLNDPRALFGVSFVAFTGASAFNPWLLTVLAVPGAVNYVSYLMTEQSMRPIFELQGSKMVPRDHISLIAP